MLFPPAPLNFQSTSTQWVSVNECGLGDLESDAIERKGTMKRSSEKLVSYKTVVSCQSYGLLY